MSSVSDTKLIRTDFFFIQTTDFIQVLTRLFTEETTT